MNHSPRSPMILGVIFFAIGSVFVMIGLGMVTWTSMWARETQSTQGTVIRMVHGAAGVRPAGKHVGNRGRRSGTKPVVEYNVENKSYEVVGLLTTSPPAYRVGDKVQVLYQPTSPADAVIDTFINRWLFPTIFGGIGSVFAIIGAIMLVTRFVRGPSSV